MTLPSEILLTKGVTIAGVVCIKLQVCRNGGYGIVVE